MVPRARQTGAHVIVVNGGPTAMDSLATVLVGGAIEVVLPKLVEGLSAS
jgi:NADPH-dependent glutamate synthase beta subunit-like oxidoreductase